MYVGIARLTLIVGNSRSLKDKRMVIRRIKDRVRARLGLAISEVGEQDSRQRAELGCAVTSGDRRKALALIDDLIRVVQAASEGQVVAVAKDAWTFDLDPAPLAGTDATPDALGSGDDRTGSGDKSAADDGWIPEAWRDVPDE